MKVLLIGWDAADESLIEPLFKRGLMPRLERFRSRASSAELQPVRPWDSAALWTSVVTGWRATGHGVLNKIEADPSRTRIRATSRWTCTARPVWSILYEAGYRAHVLGWPASHPAEATGGVAVSDQFAHYGDADSIHPPRLRDAIRALRLLPTEIDGASLLTLVPRAGELNPAAERRLYVVARFLAQTASIHAAATWALEHEPWDFAAVRYAGLGELFQVFGAAIAAAQAGENSREAQLFGDLITNALRFFDMLLARLLELAGPDASVMLVSQQGWSPPSHSSKVDSLRPRPGMLIASGPAFISSKHLPHASVCDIAPTILRLFCLPPESGSHGRALRNILSKATDDAAAAADADRPVAERTGQEGDSPEARTAESPPPDSDHDSVAHLLALGYRDQPDEFLRIAIEQLDEEQLWRLAEAWTDAGQHDRAARTLEELVELEPTSMRFRSALAEAYFHAGEHEACRRLIAALQADGFDLPLAQVGLAAMNSFEDHDAALAHLRRAEAMNSVSASELVMIGQLYLRLRRRVDAARAFDAAIALDPWLVAAHDGKTITCLYSGDPFSAECHARKAVELSPHSHEVRYRLGLALARQNRTDEAVDVLQTAIELDHRGQSAPVHRCLADLLERRGEGALASHHRALAREHE